MLTPELQKVSSFLENLEAQTSDKQTAKEIRAFMKAEDLWQIPTPGNDTLQPKVEEQIVYNAAKCLVCNETIVSRNRHDYKTCGCENETMVDGGNDYARFGAVDMTKMIKYTYVATDPHDLLREVVSWGTYGKDGKQPLTYVKVKDMSDDHIRAVIVYPRGAEWFKELLKNEVDYRLEFNISITE